MIKYKKKKEGIEMTTIGIIAEYNPFHNGHLYQIKKIKEKYPDSILILVMSGNFTQRGDLSILTKWQKTKIALTYGIDLVIELPYPFATQSADIFSYGAITILENLKVEKLIFGSESNQIKDLEIIAQTQLNNKEFDQLVKIYSKLGNNYPTALSLALFDLTGKKINTPNDLLGISYIKAIKQNHNKIIPETIKRTNDFHSNELTDSIASATAIRKALENNQDIEKYVPKETQINLTKIKKNNYFNLLKYKIITEKNLEQYQTVEEGIENKLKKEIEKSNTLEELIQNIKTKRYTYNKIKRMLTHIICGFTKEMANSMKEIKYIRILGFSNKGRKYLNKIKKEITLPLISKMTKEKDPMLEWELQTTKIYALLKEEENPQKLIEQEYKNQIIKGEKK